MTVTEAAPIRNQKPIFERLEAAKRYGLISEYLLNWRGTTRGHSPKVTVWSAPLVGADVAHRQVADMLMGLVGAGHIIVLDD